MSDRDSASSETTCTAIRSCCDTRCPPNDRCVARGPGHRHHDSFGGLPHFATRALRTEVLEQLLLRPVRHESERQFSEGHEVLGPEKAGESSRHLGLGIDVAVEHAPAELIGRGVDELNLIRSPDDPVRHPLSHANAADAFDGVGQGLNVLDVDRRDDGDASIEDLEDVLPALLVTTRSRHIGVRQLVDEHKGGTTSQHRVHIHLLPCGVPVLDVLARHHRKVPDLLGGEGTLMGLDEPDDDVGPTLEPPPTFVEHGARLPDARRRAEIDAEAAGRPHTFVFAADTHCVLS
jgi:hypothetical protein